MQLKIYHRLNQLLYGMLASDIVLIGVTLWRLDQLRDKLLLLAIIAIVYNLVLFLIFKMIENNWDKRMMQKMALKGQIAIANITETKKYTTIKDSSTRRFNLWHIKVTYWDLDMNKNEAIIIEKLNPSVESIPLGTVYITNDEKKPMQRFILQNFIVGNIPALIPIVAKFESNKAIKIKYLNVYYNNGLIIETFKQSINEAKTHQ